MAPAIVTGGAGFIGSNLVDALVSESVDVHVVDTRPNDVFVLCTDGLWSHMPPPRMASILRRHRELEDAARTLVADAVTHGSRDDVSVVLVRVREGD